MNSVPKLLIRQAVECALQAPSGDNCQPWTFVWNGADLEIYFSPERAASFLDVNDTASWISLGTTLTNIELVARHSGFEARVTVSAPAVPAARIRFEPCAPLTSPLFEQIVRRHTNRKPYRTTPLQPEHLQHAQQAVGENDDARLSFIEPKALLGSVAKITAGFDPMIFSHKEIHAGLYRWIRWTNEQTQSLRDGMPVKTLELNAWDRFNVRLLSSWPMARMATGFGFSPLMAMRARLVYNQSAAFGLLSIQRNAPNDFVRGGQALQRLWLNFARDGISFQPVSGLMFLSLRCRLFGASGLNLRETQRIETLSSKLAAILPDFSERTPVMLFRVGYSDPPSERTQRRSVNDVFKGSEHE